MLDQRRCWLQQSKRLCAHIVRQLWQRKVTSHLVCIRWQQKYNTQLEQFKMTHFKCACMFSYLLCLDRHLPGQLNVPIPYDSKNAMEY